MDKKHRLFSHLVIGLLASQVTSVPELVAGVKIDCHPLAGADEASCHALGCIWSPVNESKSKESKLPYDTELAEAISGPQQLHSSRSVVEEPWCYYPDDYQGYEITKIDYSKNEALLRRKKPSGVPGDIEELAVKVTAMNPIDGPTFNVRIYDAKKKRFEPELPKISARPGSGDGELLFFTLTEEGLLTVGRRSTGAVIFQTDLTKLIFADQFIQLNTKLNSPFVYGLGEHYDTFLKKADAYRVYSMFNHDRFPQPQGRKTYGAFPIYVNLDSNEEHAHGVYLKNSNGMDVVIQSDQSITFRTIGGILDFYFFAGPKPYDVARQLQSLVGLPDMPPRWALGFHLCRYNYNTLEKTKLVYGRTRDSGIPFDVQWNDIDYMDRHDDFTYDHDKFAGLPEFVESLHKSNMHYMIIFDPGLSQEDSYYPYKLAKEMDVLIKNASNGIFVGRVWNDSNRTVFPDFSNPKSVDLWTQLFVKFHKEIPFDGAWIDMNDISNFVDGSLDGCPENNPLENPVYIPGGGRLQDHTLCMSAKHMAGNEYDLHNLYAFYEAIATYKALEVTRPNKRPVIISRSTAPGQGRYSGHWSGDVLSTWDYLRWSIPSLIEHSMYGFSLMGSDICGFAGNTNPQLCARWSTLGAFYTFSRNHNDEVSIDQDPVALGPEVVEANRNGLTKRYSLIPYLYSLMYGAHLHGSPIIRAVPFEFYDDPATLDIEYQFMWGDGLMMSPVVEKDTYTKTTYLPRGRWYETDILPSKDDRVKVPTLLDSSGGWHVTRDIAINNMPLFYRGGRIIPMYPKVRQTTIETANQPYGLEIALCKDSMAHGELYDDDGDNVEGKYNHLSMVFKDRTLSVEMDRNDYSPSTSIGRILVYGVTFKFDSIQNKNESIEFEKHDHAVIFNLKSYLVKKDNPLVVKFVNLKNKEL